MTWAARVLAAGSDARALMTRVRGMLAHAAISATKLANAATLRISSIV
jgi:hypothetical protein